MGIPATSKQVAITATEIYRLANGKIAEQWVAADNLGMMQQLGVVPMADKTGLTAKLRMWGASYDTSLPDGENKRGCLMIPDVSIFVKSVHHEMSF